MTLTSKFKKDIGILRAAANKEIFLDLKDPKLYKKVKRYYQNEISYNDEDPESDYSLIIECIRQDLAEVEVLPVVFPELHYTASPGQSS